MAETVVIANLENNIGEITLNRADSLNTFTLALAAELNDALLQLDGDSAVRVILIKGAGKAFCAGIDVGDFFGKSAMEYKKWIASMETPLITISRLNKPVIAQVHGVAAANGAGLVAACDLAIAADTARMGLTAINVGLNCVGPVIPVSRSVGRKRAMELLLYGELIKAPAALDMGLINKVVPADDLETEARRWAAVLAAKSPIAVQIAKSAFYSAADLEYDKAFEYMNEAFARLCSTEDAKEGVSAFLEKRQPDWKEK
ncbi:enoyl-CoA hydratase [Desulfosarcina widdelii]|uniref:Enoyl-CoA hydratase domain-containing protein 3, mitochondrial n=1 Tax=Desulfosarcina widdelii TaxID=947919 RepID=A0A5K7ZK14_9BACT|nr:enoyl-CoA hydratase-related protein [Desulfosarcina widdelii]BBO76397.1 enoyl-CoA hydratase [Desulfosarcina widdelii]